MGDVAVAFFKNYYGHYFADTNIPDNIYKGQNGSFSENYSSNNTWGRAIANDTPFFNSISIYQMNRQRFTQYKMMNPIITDYNNGTMDQSDGAGLSEHTFSISYSGVKIEAGSVARDNPQGFATFHYDNSPSPNKGGGNSIFGLLGSAGSALGLLKEGNILGAALAAGNVYQKLKSGRAIKGAKEEIIGIAKESIKKSGSNLGATSKPGIRFPQNERRKTSEATLAKSQLGLILGSSKQQKPQAVENLGSDLELKSTQIKLTPQQISQYLNLDTEAKNKFTKFYTFRSQNNLDLDQVETEWNKLSSSQQSVYQNQAIEDAVKLSENGIISYNVDQATYNQLISSQVIA